MAQTRLVMQLKMMLFMNPVRFLQTQHWAKIFKLIKTRQTKKKSQMPTLLISYRLASSLFSQIHIRLPLLHKTLFKDKTPSL